MPKQTTDVSGGSYGIVYTSAGQTWTIAKGVTVSGTSGAVLSEFPDSTLINRGTASSGGYGLYLAPGGTGDVDIVNGGAGVIDAYRAILILDLDGALSLFNKGLVEGSEYAVSISGSFSADIRNEGVVRADLAAFNFQVLGSSDGISFKNAGKIVGGTYAIEVATLAYGTAKIVNTEDGIIKGGDAAIAVAERLVVKNDGLIGGRIVSGGYNDKVINKNKVKGDVWLGGGSDLFVNKGKAKAGMIDPGPGLDIVVLGFRSDKLLFDSALDATSNNCTVRKFSSGEDRLYLDEDIFTAFTAGPLLASEFRKGTTAEDADDHIIYDQKSGALYYDPDGAGGQAQVRFASFQKGTVVKATDFTVGEYTIISA